MKKTEQEQRDCPRKYRFTTWHTIKRNKEFYNKNNPVLRYSTDLSPLVTDLSFLASDLSHLASDLSPLSFELK